MVEALSIHKKWKGYTFDYEGSQKLVFTLKEPRSCLAKNNTIRISIDPNGSSREWDFDIKGYFPDRNCSISDSTGNIVAQVIHIHLFYKSVDLFPFASFFSLMNQNRNVYVECWA